MNKTTVVVSCMIASEVFALEEDDNALLRSNISRSSTHQRNSVFQGVPAFYEFDQIKTGIGLVLCIAVNNGFAFYIISRFKYS